MTNQYYNQLIHSKKSNKRTSMSYDDGRSAGLYTRGNVLLGISKFLTSLKPRMIDTLTMKLLF